MYIEVEEIGEFYFMLISYSVDFIYIGRWNINYLLFFRLYGRLILLKGREWECFEGKYLKSFVIIFLFGYFEKNEYMVVFSFYSKAKRRRFREVVIGEVINSNCDDIKIKIFIIISMKLIKY